MTHRESALGVLTPPTEGRVPPESPAALPGRPDLSHRSRRLLTLGALSLGLVLAAAALAWQALGAARPPGVARMGPAAACLLAAACISVLLAALMRQLDRFARSEASLAERNAVLEATRRRMEAQAAELQTSQALLAEQSAALETTLGHMDQGIMMVDADQTVVVCNGRAMDMLGLPRELMDAKPRFSEVVAHQAAAGEFRLPGALDAAKYDWSRIVTETQTYVRVRPCGHVMEVHSIPLARGGMVRTYTDITERRRSEEQVLHLAHHDGLTGLLNRTAFLQELGQAISMSERLRRACLDPGAELPRLAVLYLDLDGFKPVNDTHGHAAGDAILAEAARRLRAALPSVAAAARMGGDEFAVLLTLGGSAPSGTQPGNTPPSSTPLCNTPDQPEGLAQRIIAAFAEPFSIGGRHCRIGVSIGMAVCPDHAGTPDELLRHADSAMYRAKASGRGACCMFDAAADEVRQHQGQMEQDLRQALPGGQLFLDYQPIVDTTLKIRRCEALVRWRHPTRGLVGPGEFISRAEASGLIVPIGLWVMETACAAACAWPDDVHVSVNLSPVQFAHAGFPDQVAAVLRRTGLLPSRLNLEVTEGLLLEDTQNVLHAMSALRATGVRFSLDDFGTAHAGLTYLRRFPFDVIKIDRSFVQDAAVQPEARAIVAAILAIGAAFGMTVVAEGVETGEQLAQMQAMGCAEVQGYLTGRPQPASALLRAMARPADAGVPQAGASSPGQGIFAAAAQPC